MIPSDYQLDYLLPCGFCEEEFGCDYELVAVISGQMVPMKKAQGHLFFLPDWRNPDEYVRRDAIIEFFHLHCFLTRIADRQDVWKPNGGRWECGICPERFHKNRYAFRIEIGKIDFEAGIFDPYQDQRNVGLLCSDCAAYQFGEGDYEEGKKILGVA